MTTILRRKLNTAWSRYQPAMLRQKSRIWLQETQAAYLAYRSQYHYQWAEWGDFLARKTSDTIFVFGSGASLRDISPEEWQKIATHNTLGWKSFVYQDYVRADYLMLRELYSGYGIEDFADFENTLQRLMTQLQANPHFAQTLVLVQGGRRAMATNYLMGLKLAPPNLLYLRFYTGDRSPAALPATRFEDGLTHVYGTLTDAVNLAFLGGWQQIVLIGVDLYDSQYFISTENKIHERETGQVAASVIHATARSGIVDKMGEWHLWLAEHGIQLKVYNPRSLLAEVMPVFQWEEHE